MLQNLGLKIEDFASYGSLVDLYYFGAVLASGFFVAILVFNEFVEDRAWLSRPTSYWRRVYHGLEVVVQLTAQVGFIALLKPLLEVFLCQGPPGDEAMRFHDDIACWSSWHLAYCAPSAALVPTMCFFAWRLARVNYKLSSIEMSLPNIFNVTDDVHDVVVKPTHPLSRIDQQHQMVQVIAKAGMMVVTLFFSNHVIIATGIIIFGTLLLLAGIVCDPFSANQVSLGRRVEPNKIVTAIDFGTLWVYTTGLMAAIAPKATYLQLTTYCTPGVMFLGYHARSALKMAFCTHKQTDYVAVPDDELGQM